MTDTLFLSRQELIELTGYRRFDKQKHQLRLNGLKFFEARDGSPRVARAHILNPSAPSAPRAKPRLDGLARRKAT